MEDFLVVKVFLDVQQMRWKAIQAHKFCPESFLLPGFHKH